jgi:hypothetical protein
MRPYLKNTYHKNKAGGVAQSVGPEFKPQYHKKRERERERPLMSYLYLFMASISEKPDPAPL